MGTVRSQAIGALPSRKARALSRLLTIALVGAGLGGAAAGFGMGCAAQPPPEVPKPCDKQIVTLDLYGGGNINPNENGNPRPVVIRLYQLQGDLTLQNARYDDILLKPDEVLGKDVLKMDEVSLFPNDHLQIKFERIKDASFLGGVALFHGPKGQSWKTFYEFPLAPGEAACAGRGGDAGAGVADPHTAFFVDTTKIDNGSEFDESMFPDARPVRKIALPKKSGGGGAPGAAAAAP